MIPPVKGQNATKSRTHAPMPEAKNDKAISRAFAEFRADKKWSVSLLSLSPFARPRNKQHDMTLGGNKELKYPPAAIANKVKKTKTEYNTAFAAALDTSKPMVAMDLLPVLLLLTPQYTAPQKNIFDVECGRDVCIWKTLVIDIIETCVLLSTFTENGFI